MRQALRALRARPGFTIVAVATLALGFGVNAAIFSITRTVLLRPLPFADADRLIQIGERHPSKSPAPAPVIPANYDAWRARATSLEQTAAWRFVYFSLSGIVSPIRVLGFRVEPSFFRLLGVTPLIGRDFSAGEGIPGSDRVVLLTYGFWQRQFGGRAAVVGRAITVDGEPCTIVGVLPPDFKFFHVLNRELDVWRPFTPEPADRERSIFVYAKLKPGATLDTARSELGAIFASLPAETFRDGWQLDVAQLATRLQGSRPILATLQLAVALVMCIAAANIANLLLAAMAGRRRDVAVRIAIGAGRGRLMSALAMETALLAAFGAAAGVVVAIWMVAVLNGAVSYQNINRLEPFRVDFAVVAFTLGLAGAVSMLLAAAASRHALDANVVELLNEGSHGASAGVGQRRLRGLLVVLQLALSIVLATAAVELTRNALSLNNRARGVDEARVMTAQLALEGAQYADAGRLSRFAQRVLDRLATSSAIEAASIVNYPPLYTVATGVPIEIAGRPATAGSEPVVRYWVAGPRYFETMGIRLQAGREFASTDTVEREGVAIVSRRFAGRFWPQGDAIGEHLTVLLPESTAFWIPLASRRPLRVVGVVDDVNEEGVPGRPDDRSPQLYIAYAQNPTRVVTVVARTRSAPAMLAPAIREAVRAVDPDQPTFDERSLAEVRRETFARSREIASLVAAVAALALALSSMGVYGVMSFLTAARSREIGIRIALGATGTDVIRMIVRDAIVLAAAGAAIGAMALPPAMRLVSAAIAGTPPWSVVTLASVVALLTAIAAAAAAIPARRAARAACVSFR